MAESYQLHNQERYIAMVAATQDEFILGPPFIAEVKFTVSRGSLSVTSETERVL